jgi:hypothetical protein
MALLYLLCAVGGAALLLMDPGTLGMEPMEAKIQGVAFLVVGALLILPFAAGPLLPRRPWAWIYGLVLICIGLTSCCCLPASIPLLLAWLKPETKAFYGRAG